MKRVVSIVVCAMSLLSAFAVESDLDIAREALRDGLWPVARSHAEKVNTDESRLVVLESLAGERNWQEIGRRLKEWPNARGSGFDYYRAIVSNDLDRAVKILAEGGSAEGLLEARLYEAERLTKSGKTDEARAIWKELVGVTNAGERVFVAASANLMDVGALRTAYARAKTAPVRRLVGIRLGRALLDSPKDAAEGEKLIRALVKDSPDVEGACESFLAIADVALKNGRWKESEATFAEAVEIWPDAAKLSTVQEGRGWALSGLGRREEALEAFGLAEKLATDDESRAKAALKQGDVLSEMGRGAEAMARYRHVLDAYGKTAVSVRLKAVVRVRELEAKGRELYRDYRFEEARKAFDEVSALDPSRKSRMAFFTVLCLYGQGRDDEASDLAKELSSKCTDADVRADVTLWLAKFLFNRRDWKPSCRLFLSSAEMASANPARVAEALLWAARASFAENDFNQTIQTVSRLLDGKPDPAVGAQAMLLQGEALVELARFDEAVLLFERVARSDSASAEARLRAQMLKADAFFAMGADNPVRYEAALETYRAVRFGGALTPSSRLTVSFKIARALEKLKRLDEAFDQYYSQVVLAYRDGRIAREYFDDEARSAFSRAAFRLADEFEASGKDRQALAILDLVATSDVPAADEATRRIGRISKKGRFL